MLFCTSFVGASAILATYRYDLSLTKHPEATLLAFHLMALSGARKHTAAWIEFSMTLRRIQLVQGDNHLVFQQEASHPPCKEMWDQLQGLQKVVSRVGVVAVMRLTCLLLLRTLHLALFLLLAHHQHSLQVSAHLLPALPDKTINAQRLSGLYLPRNYK